MCVWGGGGVLSYADPEGGGSGESQVIWVSIEIST